MVPNLPIVVLSLAMQLGRMKLMKRVLVVFLMLQAADFATTAAVLSMGGSEQNPLVLHMMGIGTLPGLLLAKGIVFALGVAIALAGRPGAVRRASYVFGAIVVWNLSVIGRLLAAHAAS
jgi:hypothetical protein